MVGSKSDDKGRSSIRGTMSDIYGMEKCISKCKRRMKKLVNNDLKEYKDDTELEMGYYIKPIEAEMLIYMESRTKQLLSELDSMIVLFQLRIFSSTSISFWTMTLTLNRLMTRPIAVIVVIAKGNGSCFLIYVFVQSIIVLHFYHSDMVALPFLVFLCTPSTQPCSKHFISQYISKFHTSTTLSNFKA